MSRRRRPHWFVEGSVEETVARAVKADASFDRVVRHLDGTVFEDVPRGRIRAIVEASAERVDKRDGTTVIDALSQSPTTNATPPDATIRYLDREDVQYLSDRELARVVGLALERFEGSSIRPGENASVMADLYWNRSHTTVAVRTAARPATDLIGEETVRQVLEGDVNLDGHRTPSTVAIVTNTAFTDDAEATAAESDVVLLGGGHLDAWLERVRLPKDAVGTVLESGEDHDGPLEQLVELPDVPSRVRSTDPLEVEPNEITLESETSEPRGSDDTRRDDAVTQDGDPTRQPVAPADGERPPGQRGTLYADSSEDGDYGAFDDYLDELDEVSDR